MVVLPLKDKVTSRSKSTVEGFPHNVSLYCGEMAEWLKATDCKSVPAMVRWFESYSLQLLSFGDVKCMPLFKGVFILRDGRPGVIPGRRHIRFYLQNKSASHLMTLTESVDSRRQL